MKKSILLSALLLAMFFLANSQTIQNLTRVRIDPRISIDSLMAHCSEIDYRINAKNFPIIESEPYTIEARIFYFSSSINKDSIVKFMLEQGFTPANFLETIIISSTINDYSLFPIISFGATFQSASSDHDFVLCIDKSVWGCELSVIFQYYGRNYKKNCRFVGVREREFIR